MAPPVTFKGDATKLTVRQRAFVEAYLKNGENGAEAYRTAYGSKRSAAAVAQESDRLLKHPHIGPIVAEARRKAADRLQTVAMDLSVSKERISRELAKMAFVDPGSFYERVNGKLTLKDPDKLTPEQSAAIAGIVPGTKAQGGGMVYKLADRRQALTDLAKLHGYIIDRTNIRLVRSVTDLTDEELAALAAEGNKEGG